MEWEVSMDELSGDEALVLMLSVGLTIWLGLSTFRALVQVSPLRGSTMRRAPIFISLALGFFLLEFVLANWAEKQVREHRIYHVLFILLGIAWVGISMNAMALLGIRIRQDAVERKNGAVIIAASGAILGQLLCYAGANIGGGETIWSTIIPAFAGTFTWFALWGLLELLSNVSEAIAIDRDVASGWRLGGVLIAMGLILGRAMAGDFHSAEETARDFLKEEIGRAHV